MSQNAISMALIAHYRAGSFFTDALTSYPNANFTKPAPGTAWAQVRLLPSLGAPLSLGSDEMPGLMQIDLNYPINQGAAAAQIKADQIRAHFKRGRRLGNIVLGMTAIAPGMVVDGFYRVPVSVYYRAFV